VIAAAHIARDVEVVVKSGDHLFTLRARVRCATAREGIMVHEAATRLDDDDAWEVLRQVILSWLPLRLASVLTSNTFSRANAARVVQRLLTVGVPAPEKAQHDEDVEAAKMRARRIGWASTVRDYRHLCGGSLDEPWPFFISQVAGLDELRAREQASWMMAYAAVRSDKPQGRNRILSRAGYTETLTDLSEEEKQQRAAEGWANLMRMAGGGGKA